MDYQSPGQEGNVFNRRIRDRICALGARLGQAGSVEGAKDEVTKLYGEFGVGKLGLHKAIRIEHEWVGKWGQDCADYQYCPCAP